MIYRTLFGFAAFFLLATSVVKAQNSFTLQKYSRDGCFTVEKVASAVSGVCTAVPDLQYVRVFMAPNSTTMYQAFQYSDSACTQQVSASYGRCNICSGDKTIVTCPIAYNPSGTIPTFPTAADGFIQMTECYDSSCSGNTCVVQAIKASTCLAGRLSSETPSVQAAAATCAADGFKIALYTDTSCQNAVLTNHETVLSCASKSASTTSSYTGYRKYECPTANAGSLTITPPASGYKTVSYNSTADTCPGTAISTTYAANNVCTSDNNITSQAITCNGASSATVSFYNDNRCTSLKVALTVPVDSTCKEGAIRTCSSASSVVASAASMVVVAAAMIMQRFF